MLETPATAADLVTSRLSSYPMRNHKGTLLRFYSAAREIGAAARKGWRSAAAQSRELVFRSDHDRAVAARQNRVRPQTYAGFKWRTRSYEIAEVGRPGIIYPFSASLGAI